MQEKINKKLIIPLIALAIVGVVGNVYTLRHTESTTVHAQTPSVSTTKQADTDKETNDDVVTTGKKRDQQEADDKNDPQDKNEKPDGNGSTPEVENSK